MIKQNKYIYKRLKDEYLVDVQTLFLKVFNKKVSLNYLKNKYDTSYIGVKYICTIAFDKNKPIAFYGAIPQLFKSNNTNLLVAHACDSFTLKEYQKQGLHYNLALKAYKIMKENNIKFVYAFHSTNTYYSTKKLKWQEFLNFQRFHIKINTVPIARITNKLNLNTSFYNFTKVFLKKYTILNFTPFKKESTYSQLYNSSFYNYKNNFNNHFLIKIHNCIFYLKINANMEIGFSDISCFTDFKKAIEKLKRIAFVIGVNEILFQVVSNSKTSKYLTKITYSKESWLIGHLPFDDTIDINNFNFNLADLDTF